MCAHANCDWHARKCMASSYTPKGLTWDLPLGVQENRRTCETVFFLRVAICRMTSSSGSMHGRICRKSRPRGPGGSRPSPYFPVSMPACTTQGLDSS